MFLQGEASIVCKLLPEKRLDVRKFRVTYISELHQKDCVFIIHVVQNVTVWEDLPIFKYTHTSLYSRL